MDFNIGKTTSDLACLKNASMKTSVQLADVLRLKAIRYGNAYPEECTKKWFIDSFRANIQSAVRIPRSRKKDAHILETVQYADTQLQ